MGTQKPAVQWFPAHPDHFGIGRMWNGQQILLEAVVFHTTAGGSTIGQLGSWFQTAAAKRNPPGRGATHFGVDQAGRVGQFVSLLNHAFAHGATSTATAELVFENGGVNGISSNLWAVGIELLDAGTAGNHTPVQLENAAQLAAWLFATEILPHAGRTGAAIDRKHVLGHYQFDAVNRKFCPGWSEDRYTWMIGRIQELVGLEVPAQGRELVAAGAPGQRRVRTGQGALGQGGERNGQDAVGRSRESDGQGAPGSMDESDEQDITEIRDLEQEPLESADDFRARYIAEVRRQLAAAQDDQRRAAAREEEALAKLEELGVLA